MPLLDFTDALPEGNTLKQIHKRESGGKNLPPQANYDYPRSHASGVDQIQPGTWRDWTNQFGIGQQYREAYQAPPPVQDLVSAEAIRRWGPNSPYTWAASGPYPTAKKQKLLDFSDTMPAGKGGTIDFSDTMPALHDRNLGKLPDPQDPQIAARQKQLLTAIDPWKPQAPKTAEEKHLSAGDEKLAKFQLADALSGLQDWTAEKVQDAATGVFKKLGFDNPETQAHNLTSFLATAPLAGVSPMVQGIPKIEAAKVEAPKPGEELKTVGASVGAQAVQQPLHDVVAENTKRFDEANKAPGWTTQLKDASKQMRTYFEDRDTAKGLIRKATGQSRQLAAQASAAMEKYRKFADTLNTEEQLTLLDWLEGQKKGFGKTPTQMTTEAQEFANTFKDWMQKIRSKMETLPQTEQMNFKQDFVSHLWKRPKDMMSFIHEYGARTGSNYFTKKRVFESYADGIRAGFAPVSTNPIEIFARYVENASAKIGSWEAFNFAKRDNLIRYAKPGDQPEGWLPLKNMAQNEFGMAPYAPSGFASVWNPYFDHPPAGLIANVGNYIHTAVNKLTAWRLAVSAVHAGLVTFDSVASGFGNGLNKAWGGRPVGGAWEMAKSPFKPLTSIPAARKIWRIYKDLEYGTPTDQKIIQALTNANFDFTREGKIADEYRQSNIPGILKLLERKGMMSELHAAGRDIKAQPVLGSIRHIMRNATRVLNLVGEAQFQYYVPALKTQAAVDLMRTYIEKFPNATDDMIDAYARQVSDKVDARFGEMNKDNIFWPRWAKKVASSAFLSYSFTYGGLRQVARGASGYGGLFPRLAMKMTGRLPGGVAVLNDDMAYVIGVAMAYTMLTSIYQYLKTGTLPEGTEDVLHPKTGGQVMQGGKMVPERVSFTNIANTILNTLDNPKAEFYNKLNPAVKSIYELAINLNWKSKEIRNTLEPWENQAWQVIDYLFSDVMQPISYAQYEDAPEGSNISEPERLVGARTAGARIGNPEGVKKGMDHNAAKEWFEKLQSDDTAERARQGLPPRHVSDRTRKGQINRMMKYPDWNPFKQGNKNPDQWTEHPSYGGPQ